MTDDNKATQSDNLEALLNGDTVPEKFRGKTIKDVIKSYSELETAHSRQGQELGDVRRLASSLSELEVRASKSEPARKPVETDDLLTDPDKAINDAIESHPVVQKARQTADQLERQLALNSFERKHPDFRDTATNSEFKEWVNGNPALQRIAAQADNYDLDAADTLFTLWGERKTMRQDTEKKLKERENNKAKERDGTLEGSSGADASSDQIYSRAEFRELNRRALLGDKAAIAKWKDPKFQELRRNAYKDKRVS